MIRSMTGFGGAEGPLAGGRLAVEVRTVNHRHFNPHFRLPAVLQRFEGDLKERVRASIERGNVTVTARWSTAPAAATALRVDLGKAKAVTAALEQLKSALNLPGEIDLGFVARQPDVIRAPDENEIEIDAAELNAVVDGALAQTVGMREREGEALASDLGERLDAITQLLGKVERRAPQRIEAERQRLRERVRDLLEERPIDDDRLELELAILAEKLDLAEETVRLRTHVGAARDALAGEGSVGRRLAFLGQEMLREINTIGSKANDAEIVHDVIEMKGELEKFREQVENVE